MRNREARNAANRRYYAKNREAKLAYQRDYYVKNREREIQRVGEWKRKRHAKHALVRVTIPGWGCVA